jgi:hypothetical protein
MLGGTVLIKKLLEFVVAHKIPAAFLLMLSFKTSPHNVVCGTASIKIVVRPVPP